VDVSDVTKARQSCDSFSISSSVEVAVSHAACRHQVLSEKGALRVTRCSCGHVHVSIGPVSIRVEDETVPALSDLFDEAAEKLETITGAVGTGAFRH